MTDDETDDETDDDAGGSKPHDHLAKQILEAVLEPLCSVKPQFEVVAAAQAVPVFILQQVLAVLVVQELRVQLLEHP